MKVKKMKDDKIVNNKNNFCSLLLLYVTACEKCVPVKTVVTVVPAAISFLVLDTNNIFSCYFNQCWNVVINTRRVKRAEGPELHFWFCGSSSNLFYLGTTWTEISAGKPNIKLFRLLGSSSFHENGYFCLRSILFRSHYLAPFNTRTQKLMLL